VVHDDLLLHQLYAHFWAYAIIQRGVLAPGLFELRGQTALRGSHEPRYAPEDSETHLPDWGEVCRNYDYVWTYNTEYYEHQLLTFTEEVYRADSCACSAHAARKIPHRPANESGEARYAVDPSHPVRRQESC
jgi:hypothetical protein